MKYDDFKARLEGEYYKRFPHSFCKVEKSAFYGSCSVYVTCSLAENAGECINGIPDNDMFRVRFSVKLPDNFNFEGDLPVKLSLENRLRDYRIKPGSSYYVYSSRKIPYRKTAGTPEKLIATFGKFTEKLHTQLLDDVANGQIHPNFSDIVSRKI